MRKILHVNQQVIRRNRRDGTSDPAITIKTYKSNHYAMEAEILGPSRLVYSPQKPLSCGARLWIETEAPVLADGQDIEDLATAS